MMSVPLAAMLVMADVVVVEVARDPPTNSTLVIAGHLAASLSISASTVLDQVLVP